MTRIKRLYTFPNSDGTRRPAEGEVTWTQTHQRIIAGDPDEIVGPIGFTVPLVDGLFDVVVSATGLSWVWRVDEKIKGLYTRSTYVAVPDLPLVDFSDLVQVNIATLEPESDSPEPAWFAYVDTLESQATQAAASAANSEIITANNAALIGPALSAASGSASASAASASGSAASAITATQKATEAGASATSSANSASAASASATSSAGSATASASSANAAQTARTGAEAAQTGAQTAKTGSETAQTGAQIARADAEAARDAAEVFHLSTVTTGEIDENDDLILIRTDGSEINAGSAGIRRWAPAKHTFLDQGIPWGLTFGVANDSEPITLANSFRPDIANTRIRGVRIWVPFNAAGFPLTANIMFWATSGALSGLTPAKTVSAVTLVPGQWNNVTFDTPVNLPQGQSFMVGYSSTAPYIFTNGLSAGFESQAADGFPLFFPLANRGRYRMSSGGEGTTSSYYGVEPVLDEGIDSPMISELFVDGEWREVQRGENGPANTLSIGTVTTGAPGSSASASISGSAPSQTLGLTIPRGDVGAQGNPGDLVATAGPANVTGSVDLTGVTFPSTRIWTLTGNVTLTLPTPSSTSSGTFTLVLTQDTTGSRTITWPAAVKWPDGIAQQPAAAVNTVSVIHLLWTGTAWLGLLGGKSFA